MQGRGNGTNMDVENSGDFFMLGQPKTRVNIDIYIYIFIKTHVGPNCANGLKCVGHVTFG